MLLNNLLFMTGIAMALATAGVGYTSGRTIGKGVFVLGVAAAVATLILRVVTL